MRLFRHRRRASAPDPARASGELAGLLDIAARLAAAVSRADRLAQERFGLSGAQLFVLRLLADAPAESVNELAARTGTHQSTVSVVVSRLVRRGLVARNTDAADGRRVTLALTPAGRALARRAPGRAYSRLAEALRQTPQRERSALARALSRLVDALWEGEPAGGGLLEEPPLQPRIGRRDRRRR